MLRYAMMFLLGEFAILAGLSGHTGIGFMLSAVAGLAAVVWGKEGKENTDAKN